MESMNTKPSKDVSFMGYVYDPDKLLRISDHGQIYAGKRQRDRTSQAIKVISREIIEKYQLHQNLLLQYKLMSSLSHSNILTYNEVQFDDENWYFISEIEDYSLEDVISQPEKYSLQLVDFLAKRLIEGIKYMHSKNIAHRNLTPSNILIFNEIAKISGLEYACNLEQNNSLSLKQPPLSKYSCPPNLNISPTQADLYSLGMILLEFLIGRKEFTQFLDNNTIDMTTIPYRKQCNTYIVTLIQALLNIKNSPFTIKDIEKSYFMARINYIMDSIKQKHKPISIIRKGQTIFINFCQEGIKNNIKKNTTNPIANKLSTKDKENIAPPELKQQINSQMNTQLAFSFKIVKKLNEVTTNQEAEIISCPITYKQAVGLINYCRIAVHISKDIGQVMKHQIEPVVLRILSNLIQKIDNDGIIYTSENDKPGQKTWLIKKSTQYFKRYTTKQKLNHRPFIQFENLPELSHIVRKFVKITHPSEKFIIDYYIFFKFIVLPQERIRNFRQKSTKWISKLVLILLVSDVTGIAGVKNKLKDTNIDCFTDFIQGLHI